MGTADVVPGVSGGTMALMLGIYQPLISAIKSFDLTWFKSIVQFNLAIATKRPHFPFLIPIGLGIFSALLFFTRILPLQTLIKTHPEPIYALFFGLIIGSIFVLLHQTRGVNFTDLLALLTGTVLGLFIFNLIPVNTPNDTWFIFVSGIIAICAMILPGISGSLILLVLKKYAYILDGISRFDFSIIIPFGLGIITGLIFFSRLLSWLLNRLFKTTLMSIIGLLVASLWIIWPFQLRTYETIHGQEHLINSIPVLPETVSSNELFALMLLSSGVIFVLSVDWFSKHSKQ